MFVDFHGATFCAKHGDVHGPLPYPRYHRAGFRKPRTFQQFVRGWTCHVACPAARCCWVVRLTLHAPATRVDSTITNAPRHPTLRILPWFHTLDVACPMPGSSARTRRCSTPCADALLRCLRVPLLTLQLITNAPCKVLDSVSYIAYRAACLRDGGCLVRWRGAGVRACPALCPAFVPPELDSAHPRLPGCRHTWLPL